ncbi:MAG: hypothetical protein O7G83_16555 [Proteobacteria bacterium]|nr:hypothetical protein [Pseudomonadota bacterium]
MALRPALPFLLVAILAAVVYVPGIGGGFTFDDYFAIVLNDELDIDPARPVTLLDAAFSSTSGPLKRPVAMLSFAANRTLTGIDPVPFKLTNIAIHVVNAVLVLLLLQLISTALSPSSRSASAAVACVAAALWAVHPLNLTSVLYVVQRMTSLSGTWMLIALVLYAAIRVRQIQGGRVAGFWWLAVVASWALGLLTKETALLLPLYVVVLECSVFRFEAGSRLRSIYRGAVIAGTCSVAAILILTPDTLLGGYAGRSFSLAERLLTESRVVMFYLRQLLVPDLASFALFHDDIRLSRGLLDPPSTLLSLAALAALVAGALATRRRYVAFGISWFLVGHLLESTIYPLELVHEHRNYLPAIGLIFMLVTAVAEWLARLRWRGGRLLLAAAAIAVCGSVTAIRASIWSDPDVRIEFEVLHHPQSARSQYELGRVRLERGAADGDRVVRKSGVDAMERAAELAPIPTLALTALISSGVDDGDGARIERVLAALRTEDRDVVRIGLFQHFVKCQAYGRCTPAPAVVRDLTEAILGGPPLTDGARRQLVEWLAIYYIRVLGDTPAALAILEELASKTTASYATRARFAEALFGVGRTREAAQLARQVRRSLPWKTVFTQRPLRRRLKVLINAVPEDA